MKIKSLLLIVATLLALISCKAKDNQQSNNANDDMKTLVIYFSATGNTRQAANAIVQATGGDILEIKAAPLYTEADLDWRNDKSRSSVVMHDAASRPQIDVDSVELNKYDMVYIGYPIWWNEAPHEIYTFIEANNLQGKRIIPFATSGGDAITNSVKVLRQLYPGLKIEDGKLLNTRDNETVKEWVDSIN